MTLDREKYKVAIPQLDKKLKDLLDNNVIINRTVVSLSSGRAADLNTFLAYFTNLTTGYFQAIAGDIQYLTSREAYIASLTADEAFIDAIKADVAEVGYITADTAIIGDLTVEDIAVGRFSIGGVEVTLDDLLLAIKQSTMASEVTWYKKSASQPSAPSVRAPSDWSTTEPAYDPSTDENMHLWSCMCVTYADDTQANPHFVWTDVHKIESWDAAKTAYTYAGDAHDSAIEANRYANSALTQLSIVEDVVGVVEWMEENCSYRLTQDQTVQIGKFYYTRSGTSPNYIYTVVTNPVDADIATYYEMYVSGDTVRNFITSHLSVTSQGMYLQTDGVGSRLLLSTTDGVVLFGPNGDVIGRYGEDAQIGSDSGYNIRITTSGNEPKLAFRFGTDTEIAYITGDMLYIPKAVVVDSMQVGDAVSTGMGWRWIINKTDANLLGNLTLTWIGE